MMYQYTQEQHQQVVDALDMAESYLTDLRKPRLQAALAMLKAMQPVSHPKTETPAEANAGADSLSQREKMLLEALKEAEMSLRTIELQSDRDEYLNDMVNIRGYACSRGSVARAAITAVEEKVNG